MTALGITALDAENRVARLRNTDRRRPRRYHGLDSD